MKRVFDDLENLEVNGRKISPKIRGYEFEKFLQQLFQNAKIDTIEPFTRNAKSEQIDGAIHYKNRDFLLEAKWIKSKVSRATMDAFSQKITRSGKLTMGLFISVSGFTVQAINSLPQTNARSIILIDGNDIFEVLDGKRSLAEMLDYKIKRLTIFGEAFAKPS